MIAVKPPTIVAEICKCWIDGNHADPSNPKFLGQMFEQAIAVNHHRGYRLASYVLKRCAVESHGSIYCSETIIAVFELAE